VVWFYPLTTKRVQAINDELRKYRDIE